MQNLAKNNASAMTNTAKHSATVSNLTKISTPYELLIGVGAYLLVSDGVGGRLAISSSNRGMVMTNLAKHNG